MNKATRLARVFAEGCDARLRGLAITENPYPARLYHDQWRQGWQDVDANWGRDALHPVQVLPDTRRRA